METPRVLVLVEQLVRLELRISDDSNSFFIRGQELLTKLQETGEAVSETFFNALVLNGLQMRYETGVLQKIFNPATHFTGKGKKKFIWEHTAQAQCFSGTGLERNCKKVLNKGNCVVSGTSAHLRWSTLGKKARHAARISRKVT